MTDFRSTSIAATGTTPAGFGSLAGLLFSGFHQRRPRGA